MTLSQLFVPLLNELQSQIWPQALQLVIAFAPILVAVILYTIFWSVWVKFVRAQYFLSLKYSVLEIRLPKESFKSPKAMELFLNAFHNTVEGNFIKKYWDGEVRPWFSLELVSIEGQVKFIIWTRSQLKAFIESSLYAQFPGIEIREIEDYTKSVHYDPKEIKTWFCEFKFAQNDAYPIKTYVDYGLDKDPKEEFKVDPLVPLLEFLGSVGPNQQVWIQILIQAHTEDKTILGKWFKKEDKWKKDAKKIVNEIMLRDSKTKVSGIKDEETGFTKLPTISSGEKDIVDAIERSQTKYAFDAGIRAIYIAKKEMYNPSNIGGIVGNMKHFSSPHLNGFKLGSSWLPKIEYPWQDFNNFRKNKYSRLVLAAYKRRSYFHPPFKCKPMILNTEELATIFHFPGQVAGTPTLERVPSKKAEAPSNLPI